MELSTILLTVAILLPILFGLILFFVKNYKLRTFLVVTNAILLSANSIALFFIPDFQFTPTTSLVHNVIMLLDFIILIYIIYAGIMRKNFLIILFGFLQIIPLGGFEIILHAEFAVAPAFNIDLVAKIMIAIISIIGSIITCYGVKYLQDYEDHIHIEKSRAGRFFFWCVLFLGAMNGLVASNSLYYLYFFWEVTTLTSYMLIGHDLSKQALNNAARALWLNSLGGTAFCFGLLYLYAYCGGYKAMSLLYLTSEHTASLAVLLPVALLIFAGFTKSAMFPFQSWLLGAMVAPTPVSALLHSSTMVKAGVYLVLRMTPILALPAMGKTGIILGYSTALVGAFTFLAGALLAISQTTGKKVLAYSTISNLGLIIACAGLNTSVSIVAAIALIVFHAISKALLFMCAGTVEHIVWSREIDDMQGLVAKAPLTAGIMVFAILTMFLPPFGMLFSKWLAVESATALSCVHMGNKALVWGVDFLLVSILLMFAFASAATMVFWSQWLGALIQRTPKIRKIVEKFSPAYHLPLLILLGLALLFSVTLVGVLPTIINAAKILFAPGLSNDMVATNILYASINATHFANGVPIGIFPATILSVIGVALCLPFFTKKVAPEEISPVYMCGDNADFENVESDAYKTAKDDSEPLQLSSYYFMKYFGETPLTPLFNSGSIVFIVFMFGVVLGVILR